MSEYIEVPGERWFPIPDFDYEVSDLGRVRGFRHRGGKPGILNGKSDKDGYIMMSLSRNGRCATKKLHRLVAQAFCDRQPFRDFVNHKNGIRSDNRAKNLEWVTAKENTQHALRVLGSILRGAKHPSAKLTQEQADSLRSEYASGGITMKNLGKKYGIGVFATHRIIHNMRYVPLH